MREGLFDQALDGHGGLIARIVSAHERDPALREDLRQDVALALWRALPGWREECALRTFVARVAHNVCVSHQRRAVREPPRGELSPQLDAATDLPDAVAIDNDLRRRLSAAVADLPAALREVAVLGLEGFTNQEIVDTLGLSSGTVATRLSRAKAMLRERMGQAS
ncbi:sigma-70 family RNA polymerase sigma factor [Novosphingobium sp.]|uniref:RNA polymerase sigma factor n=1 Tax=Novosphingobium sp. TaxID=1874826 RepID=UPI00262877E4|nr:sigma-70 family RNA polymerase sigma factor [Novosphingobium sp.]